MNKFIIALLLIAPLVPGAWGNGVHVGGSGGSVEYEFAYVAQTIANFVAPCASSSTCDLTPAQRAIVDLIRNGAARDLPGALRFDSASAHPGFPSALYTLQDSLVLINVDKLYTKDAAGEWQSMPFNQVIATVVEIEAFRISRQGLGVPGVDVSPADLGKSVAALWDRDLIAINVIGSDARLMAIGGTLLVSDNRKVTDLSGAVLDSLKCWDEGDHPVSIQSIQNLYWVDDSRPSPSGSGFIASAVGTIRYSCAHSTLVGTLRLFLPFEKLPDHEIGLIEKDVRIRVDTIRRETGSER